MATRLAGENQEMPITLAPTGMAGMLWPDGEIGLARTAAGIPYVMSTMSICPIDAVAVDRPFWF